MFASPKKSLGQNFLVSPGILQKIITASCMKPSDTILEIGPGRGALTRELLDHAHHVVAIEKDDALFGYLSETFSAQITTGAFRIIHGDVLVCDPYEILGGTPYKLIANIPYNITGALIEKFLSGEHQPTDMVIMVQREVAERICSRDGKESLLSICVRTFGDPVYISTVKPGNFNPPPSIDSAILAIRNISRSRFLDPEYENLFFMIVRAGFAHKRKTIFNNLRVSFDPELIIRALEQANISHTTRPEDITLDDWHRITHIMYTDAYGESTS